MAIVSKVSCMWKDFFIEHIALDHVDLDFLKKYSSLEAEKIEGKETEVQIRIGQLMHRLKPMGDDEF